MVKSKSSVAALAVFVPPALSATAQIAANKLKISWQLLLSNGRSRDEHSPVVYHLRDRKKSGVAASPIGRAANC
jgi:hypothetical protein